MTKKDEDEIYKNEEDLTIYSPAYNYPILDLKGKFIKLVNQGECYMNCEFTVHGFLNEEPPKNCEEDFICWLVDEHGQKFPLFKEESFVIVLY